MSDNNYNRERNRAKLRADGSIGSLLIWGAVGLIGSGVLYGILMSIK